LGFGSCGTRRIYRGDLKWVLGVGVDKIFGGQNCNT